MTPEGHAEWLDHHALDLLLAQAIDDQPNPEARAALREAFLAGDGELIFHEDDQGEWVGVRFFGLQFFRAHRSRVQRQGAN